MLGGKRTAEEVGVLRGTRWPQGRVGLWASPWMSKILEYTSRGWLAACRMESQVCGAAGAVAFPRCAAELEDGNTAFLLMLHPLPSLGVQHQPALGAICSSNILAGI